MFSSSIQLSEESSQRFWLKFKSLILKITYSIQHIFSINWNYFYFQDFPITLCKFQFLSFRVHFMLLYIEVMRIFDFRFSIFNFQFRFSNIFFFSGFGFFELISSCWFLLRGDLLLLDLKYSCYCWLNKHVEVVENFSKFWVIEFEKRNSLLKSVVFVFCDFVVCW